MEYFKKIFTEKLPEIQNELRSIIPVDTTKNYNYVNYKPEDILPFCPHLAEFLIEQGLIDKLQAMASITAGPNFTVIPHKDGHKGGVVQSKFAFNIPIDNYLNSQTSFFIPNVPNIDELLPEKKSKFGHTFRPYTYEYLDKVASLTIDMPSFLRIDEIHDVVNWSDQTRHVLSIRFNPDPQVFDDNN